MSYFFNSLTMSRFPNVDFYAMTSLYTSSVVSALLLIRLFKPVLLKKIMILALLGNPFMRQLQQKTIKN